jgi:NitT/TauT family transport system substrate-binding protein
MRLNWHPAFLGWALLVVLAVVGACAPAPPAPRTGQASSPAGGAATPAAAAATPAKVNLGLAFDTLGRAPLYVAMRKGYFTEQGLEVDRTLLQGDSPLVAAFLAREVDVAGFGADTILKMVAEGRDVQAFYGMGQGQAMFLVASKRFVDERGVDPNAPLRDKAARLKGMSLGAPSLGGLTELYSRWFLRKGGLTDDDISVVQVGGATAGLVAAMDNDQIQGFVSSPPGPQEAVLRGRATIIIRPTEVGEFNQYIYSSLSTSKAYGDRNGDALRRLAAGMDRGKQYIQSNFEEALEEIRKDFPNMQREALVESVSFYRDTFGRDGKMNPEAWRDTLGLLRDAGLIKGDSNAGEGVYWTNKYLP